MRLINLFLAVMLGTAMAQQPTVEPAHLAKTLRDKQITSTYAIAKASGAYDVLAKPAVKFTVLAPTNEAVMAFLNSMGMTLDELKRDEHLVDDIVAYHTLVGYNIRKADILAVQDKFNGAVPVYTLARPWHVTVMHKDGKSLVKDAQGNVAHILRALEHDNHVVHVIDKVLFSGNYFTTLGSLFRNFPSTTSATAQAIKAAGLSDLLSQQGFADTLFIPNNKAMARLDGQSLPAKELKSVIDFHMLKGRHVMPQGLKKGQAMMTMLPGQSIAVYTSSGASGDYVTDASGQKVEITKANLFVGRGVAHGIAAVLQPARTAASSAPAATTNTAASAQVTATAATTASSSTTPQATTTSSKSSIGDFIARIFAHKSAVVNSVFGSKPIAAAATLNPPKTVAKGPADAAGRKLLQAATPAFANPNVQGNEQHLDDDNTLMGEQEDSDDAIVAAEDPSESDPSKASFADPKIDTGKSISEETSDTLNQEAAEDQVSGVEDAADADPSLPAWAQPTLATGKSIGDASATTNADDSVDAINNAVGAYDSGTCC